VWNNIVWVVLEDIISVLLHLLLKRVLFSHLCTSAVSIIAMLRSRIMLMPFRSGSKNDNKNGTGSIHIRSSKYFLCISILGRLAGGRCHCSGRSSWVHVTVFIYIRVFHSFNFLFEKLKGQSHEMFDLGFFHQTIPSRPLIHALKYCTIEFCCEFAEISSNMPHSAGSKCHCAGSIDQTLKPCCMT
jgi:hypothetical protein